jgi:hypothetical protein
MISFYYKTSLRDSICASHTLYWKTFRSDTILLSVDGGRSSTISQNNHPYLVILQYIVIVIIITSSVSSVAAGRGGRDSGDNIAMLFCFLAIPASHLLCVSFSLLFSLDDSNNNRCYTRKNGKPNFPHYYITIIYCR